jgi:hypothetical protein
LEGDSGEIQLQKIGTSEILQIKVSICGRAELCNTCSVYIMANPNEGIKGVHQSIYSFIKEGLV